jgi:hypothetical protein
VNLPLELWNEEEDRRMVESAAALFDHDPVIFTDQLTNSVWLNPPAEELLNDDAEALVNRTASSLLGFGNGDKAPAPLEAALLGRSDPWKAVVNLPREEAPPAPAYCEASAVLRGERLVCGIVRLKPSGN